MCPGAQEVAQRSTCRRCAICPCSIGLSSFPCSIGPFAFDYIPSLLHRYRLFCRHRSRQVFRYLYPNRWLTASLQVYHCRHGVLIARSFGQRGLCGMHQSGAALQENARCLPHHSSTLAETASFPCNYYTMNNGRPEVWGVKGRAGVKTSVHPLCTHVCTSMHNNTHTHTYCM